PPGFTYPVGNASHWEMWVPWIPKSDQRSLTDPNRSTFMSVVARLKDGVSVTTASTRLDQLAGAIREETPIFHRDWTLSVQTLRDALFGRVSGWMLLLLGASGFLLLVACSNVANLMLLRAASREREIGIRLALGATRGRIARSMLAEATWLAGSATAL